MASPTKLVGDVNVTGTLTAADIAFPNNKIPRASFAQELLVAHPLPIGLFKVWDDVQAVLPNAATGDDLGIIDGTFGTDTVVINAGDTSSLGGSTRYGRFQFALPPWYDDGQTMTIRVSAGMVTTVSDTTATVDLEVYKGDREGGIGSDLCATAATTCNSLTFADIDFTITPTGLQTGDWFDMRIAVAVNDGATGTAVIATIGAVELLIDIKG